MLKQTQGTQTAETHRTQLDINRDATKRLRGRIGLLAIILAALLLAAVPTSASAAVEWKAEIANAPTNWPQNGPGFLQINVMNTGDTDSSGSPTVKFDLPANTTLQNPGVRLGAWICDIAVPPSGVSCSKSSSPIIQRRSMSSDGFFTVHPLILRVMSAGAPEGPFELQVEISGGGGATATFNRTIDISDRQLPFGIVPGMSYAGAFEQSGTPDQRAGGHPFSATAYFEITTEDGGHELSSESQEFSIRTSGGGLGDALVDLPPGFIGNPNATPKCQSATEISNGGGCPPETQVGYAKVSLLQSVFGQYRMVPVYNVEPPANAPAQFSFQVATALVSVFPSLRADGTWGLRVSAKKLNEGDNVYQSEVTLWGVPADPAHDFQRCETRTTPRMNSVINGCSPDGRGDPGVFASALGPPRGSTAPLRPFLSNPTECTGEPVKTTFHVDNSFDPAPFDEFGDPILSDPRWKSETVESPALEDCDLLPFDPSTEAGPTSLKGSSPSGLHYELRVPQTYDNPDGLATAHLKDTVVKLPAGMTVNPSSADGLGACSTAQIGLKETAPRLIFSKAEPECPLSSKIGDVSVETPLLDDPLNGQVFLARQFDNPFDSLLAIYLVVRGPGLLVKLAGEVKPDPKSGQLTATFKDNPQVPFNKLTVDFKSGARAPLVTPSQCGIYEIESEFTSWAQPDETVPASSGFTISEDCDGGFNPTFQAGTESSDAGKSSTFSLRVVRPNGNSELKSIQQVKLPEGLLARVAEVPLCEDAQAAVGACPESSRVGRVQVAAGAGQSPLWVPQAGKEPTGVYLTGPYKGAPYGLSIKVPAQAGPFDLGTVVVRSALHVDERTAAVSSGVDETRLIATNGAVTEVLPEALPRILEGIVLNQREIRLIMDREGFMINPTDCSPSQITAQLHSYASEQVNASDRFTAVNCARLGFAPKFRAKILDKGRRSTLRSWHPRTRFTVVPRKGDANIGGARVALPSSTILDQANIGTTCTRAQMAARNCPAKSVVGYAKAWSPLLRKAVEGPVYLAANGGVRPLPDLAAVLDGEIRVVLQGEVSTLRSGGKARLQNTFRVVPDAPVTRFALTMRGGKNRGLLVNSTDLCRTRERGVAVFRGQNNRQYRLRPRIATTFKGCGKVRRQARRKAARKPAASRSSAKLQVALKLATRKDVHR